MKAQAKWSSGLTFILATTGAAVGLGNIWKFPYIVGKNGGGAFVCVYLLCILFIGIPMLMAEVMLGRSGNSDPSFSMKRLAQKSNVSTHWQSVGLLTIVSSVLVLSFYSVIAGWALHYVFLSLNHVFDHATATQVANTFNQFIANPHQVILWHTLIMFFTIAIVAMGVEKGLERWVCLLFPAMVALLLIIIGYAMSSGFFAQGLTFLFYPDFSKITAQGVLSALGHAFFTLSLAIGTIMMYGAYLPKSISIVKTSVFIALSDTLIALMAGLAIFPVVFSHGLAPSAGPGLLFQTLPLALGNMPYGQIFCFLFFIMVVFAALTSAISLLEPSVAFLMRVGNISRVKATFYSGSFVWLLGLASALSFSVWKDVLIFNHTIFDFLDTFTSNYCLPIAGFFIAVFSVHRFKYAKGALNTRSQYLYQLWRISLGYITPVAIFIIFVNSIGLLPTLQ